MTGERRKFVDEIFLRAVMDKAKQPESWSHIPRLIEIASNRVHQPSRKIDYAPKYRVALFAASELHAIAALATTLGAPSFAGSKCNNEHAFFQRIF